MMQDVFHRRQGTPFWFYRDLQLADPQRQLLSAIAQEMRDAMTARSLLIFPVDVERTNPVTDIACVAFVPSSAAPMRLPKDHQLEMDRARYLTARGVAVFFMHRTPTYCQVAPKDSWITSDWAKELFISEATVPNKL